MSNKVHPITVTSDGKAAKGLGRVFFVTETLLNQVEQGDVQSIEALEIMRDVEVYDISSSKDLIKLASKILEAPNEQ